jgi:hypothetical protein
MQHVISTSAGLATVDATEPVPGLRIFELPTGVSPMSPYRWILAHHDSAALASFTTEAEATRAARQVAPLADWTRNAMTAANEISLGGKVERLMELLHAAGGQHPNA